MKNANTRPGRCGASLTLTKFKICLTAVFYCLSFGSAAAELTLALNSSISTSINYEFLPPYPGLSIVRDSIPLLRVKAFASRVIQTDENHTSVRIETISGTQEVAAPAWLGLGDYLAVSRGEQLENLWLSRNQEITKTRLADTKKGSLLQYEIPIKFPKLIKSIIGEGGPGLKVTGYRRIEFSGKSTWISGQRSTATSRQSKFPSLDMKQTSRFTIDGNIGSKITVKVDQDSKRLNDLENNIQLRYNGEPEEIIQTIEAGNTNLSIGGARFVGYSQSLQGLFGFKSTARLGGLDLTMIMSQEKGASNVSTFRAGAEALSDTIRDYQYLPRTFYYLGRSKNFGHDTSDFFAGDSIIFLDLYVADEYLQNSYSDDTLKWGRAVVDPKIFMDSFQDADTATPDYRRGEWAKKKFRRLIPDRDYFLSPKQYWIKLNRQLSQLDVLAAYMEVKRADGLIDTIGNLDTTYKDFEDSLVAYLLKLLKMEKPTYNNAADPTHPFVTWDYEWKNVYNLGIEDIDPEALTIDIYKGPEGAEDIQLDRNSQDSIPFIRITGLDAIDLSGDSVPDNKVDLTRILLHDGYLVFPERLPFISDTSYTGNLADTLQIKPDSIYYSHDIDHIRAATTYYIYFHTTQRKTTYSLGSQAILEGSEVVKLNGQVLRAGTDYNINYEFGEITFLTEAAQDPNAEITVDYQSLDFIQSQKKSLYGIQGEKAFSKQLTLRFNALYKSVKPNESRPRIGNEPNRTFVWDVNLQSQFEPKWMTSLIDALPMVSTSAPSRLTFAGEIAQSLSDPNTRNKIYMDDFEGVATYTDLGVRRATWTFSSPPAGLDTASRGKLIWFNPYNQIPIKEIWPNREAGRSEERVNVLSLRFTPDSLPGPRSSSWGGVMRAMLPGTEKQSRSKYLEIWVQINKNKNNPVLHVDLGRISEDANADGKLNTEDSLRGGRYNGVLEEEEDKGIDGKWDYEEEGYDLVTNPDPNGDNWFYDSNNPDDYSHINGTERNANDPDRGYIPDTEDLNRNQSVDVINDYFAFAVDLDDSTYFVPGTENNGWRLYRVPLKDSLNYSTVGNSNWDFIDYARIWVTGVDSTTTISIAEIRLVGNRWETQPSDSLALGESFDVATKNTYEHPDYVPPPGIAGNYDPDQNVREAEQSLAIIYENISPGKSLYAYRTFYKAEDYTYYGKIKMFVHGPDNPGPVRFFYRIGNDSLNFYEYHTNIYPLWDERNWVELDFAAASALKLTLQELKKDSTSLNEYSEGNYRVKGNPSFSRVQWLAVGIQNTDSLQSLSGEIWVDEMTSTDVRKKPGWATEAKANFVFADVLTLNTNLTRIDSEFHNLTARASGATSTAFGLSGSLQAHRFLPPSWEMSLPISFNYSRSLTIPRLVTGSDIVLPEDQRQVYRTESTRRGFSIAPRFNKNTKNWLYNLTLKRGSISYSWNDEKSYSLSVPINRKSSYSTSFAYNASPGKQLGIPFFKWVGALGVPKKLADTKFGIFPKTLTFSGGLSGSKVYSVTSAGVVTDNFTRGFSGGIGAQMDLVPGIPLNYNYSTTRDLRNDSDIKFSLNPKKAKFGFETGMRESFNTSYSPNWFKFMTQSFSYKASYSENADRNQVSRGARNVTNSSGYAVNGSFNLSYIFQKLLPKPGSPQKSSSDTTKTKPPSDTTKSQVASDTTQKKATPQKPGLIKIFFKELASIPKNISPLVYNYSKDRSFNRPGLLERPSLWYRLGFQTQTDVLRLSDIDPLQSYVEGSNITERFGLKSGVILFGTISTTFGYTYSQGMTQGTNQPRFRRLQSYPEFTLQWSKVKIPPLLNRYINNMSYEFRYAHDISEEGNRATGAVEKRGVTNNFSPLAGITLNWKNGINSSIRVDKGKEEGRELRAEVSKRTAYITNSTAVSFASNYSFSSPHGIKIPLFGRLKFQSNLNLSLDVRWRSSARKSASGTDDFSLSASSSELSISPRGGYNFSSQINGGFLARWSDRHDRITGAKTHNRELGFWVEVKF